MDRCECKRIGREPLTTSGLRVGKEEETVIQKRYFLLFLLLVLDLFSENTSVYYVTKQQYADVQKQYDIYAGRRVEALVRMMNESVNLGEKEKLIRVNSFFNKTPYASDKRVWQVSDYWATRLEFIGKDRGDCEDYVIAKYFTLKELGIESSKMYITYGMSKRHNIPHLVLSYYETPTSIPLILDNYNQKIFPATHRKDIIPIYSFKGEDLLNAKRAKLGQILPAATNQKHQWDSPKIMRKKESM